MKLKIGPTRRFRATNTRGAAFHGMGAFVGVGRTQRAHVYSAHALPVGPDDYKKIDPEKLAEELEVDMCFVNQRALLDDGRARGRRRRHGQTFMVSK